jgi:hypothetical protein
MSAICLTSMLCLLAAVQVRPNQEVAVPPKIEKFLEHCETLRRGAILQIEYTLRRLRSQSPTTRGTSQRMADLEEQLRVLRSNTRPVVPQLSFPPQAGAIGRLPRLSCHVDQVVTDDEMLVRCYFPVVVTTVRRFQAHHETVMQPVRFLIRGLPTKSFDVGSDVEMLQVFEIGGKERYRTVEGGSKDVLVLTEFDMKAIEPFFRKPAGRDQTARRTID